MGCCDGGRHSEPGTEGRRATAETVGLLDCLEYRVILCKPVKMSCIPASASLNPVLSPAEPQMEDSPQRRGSRAYQIFPEANQSEEPDYPEDFLYKRERLPSIVVEPTELSEAESGELGWPPGRVEEQDDHATCCHAQARVGGARQEHMEEGSAERKSSIGPSQSQPSLFRLTPPASPTPPEAAPPCPRS